MMNIAIAENRRTAKWRNKIVDWEEVVDSLRETTRTQETVKQYYSYTKDKQDDIKDVGGFVGGYLREGKRKKGFVEYRQVVCLDADHATDLSVWENFALMEYAGCMYTTHKHKPEAPRFRIVFPLSRPVSEEEYEVVARVVASWLGIDTFDDTTYQATRLMYYPSTSRDGEYLFNESKGTIIDPDNVLEELPNWQDPTTWPTSSRVKETVKVSRASEVEDPEVKTGVVGAFCRAYSIEEAIAEFLNEVYEPCPELGDDRYSLIGASTSGGLVVYDNKLAYSHHATDVVSGKLCNAFDLVRLHKFAGLDDSAKSNVEPNKLPSYKAMSNFAANIKSVKRELLEEKRSNAEDFDTLEKEAVKVAESDEWLDDLEMSGKSVKPTINNTVIVLRNDAALKGRFGFDEFEQREVATSALPWDRGDRTYPRPLSDADDAALRWYLETHYELGAKAKTDDAMSVVSRANSYHPVRDYLDALKWDGEERLDALLINLFGAEDSEYIRAVTRKSFTAAVARVYRSGCKFDHVLVLIGDQGVGKSTVFQRMGGRWFSDSLSTFNDNKALEAVQGNWIIELGELAGLKRNDVETVKHFVSKREDRFRVAYGKRVEHFPRRCVFFGTTNESDFLRDVTGNRRFWVVDCKGCTGSVRAWDYLTPETVDQLWAEAKHRYNEGEPLYLEKEHLERIARDTQDSHLEQDERAGLVQEYLERRLPENWRDLDLYQRRHWLEDKGSVGTEGRDKVCVLEIWAECLGKDPQNITRRDSFEISRLLKGLRGWTQATKAVKFRIYGVQKCFEKGNQNR